MDKIALDIENHERLMENANARRLRCIGPDGAYAVCQAAFTRSLGGAPADDPRHVYAYYLWLVTGRGPKLEDTPDFYSLPHPDTVDFVEAARVHLGWK